MPKFRKKPVVIDASQLIPPDFIPPGVNFGCFCTGDASCSLCGKYWVRTLEGPLVASYGDWIITGVKGEQYPCKPDIFEATYEPVDA